MTLQTVGYLHTSDRRQTDAFTEIN